MKKWIRYKNGNKCGLLQITKTFEGFRMEKSGNNYTLRADLATGSYINIGKYCSEENALSAFKALEDWLIADNFLNPASKTDIFYVPEDL